MSKEDIENEQNAVDKLHELSRLIATECKAVWHWGDGEGDYIISTVKNYLYEAGLRTGAEQQRKPLRKHKKIPAHVRYQVILRDGFGCHYCKVQIRARDITFDHKKPVVTGGEDTVDNLVVCCKSCNSAKGIKPYSVAMVGRSTKSLSK